MACWVLKIYFATACCIFPHSGRTWNVMNDFPRWAYIRRPFAVNGKAQRRDCFLNRVQSRNAVDQNFRKNRYTQSEAVRFTKKISYDRSLISSSPVINVCLHQTMFSLLYSLLEMRLSLQNLALWLTFTSECGDRHVIFRTDMTDDTIIISQKAYDIFLLYRISMLKKVSCYIQEIIHSTTHPPSW